MGSNFVNFRVQWPWPCIWVEVIPLPPHQVFSTAQRCNINFQHCNISTAHSMSEKLDPTFYSFGQDTWVRPVEQVVPLTKYPNEQRQRNSHSCLIATDLRWDLCCLSYVTMALTPLWTESFLKKYLIGAMPLSVTKVIPKFLWAASLPIERWRWYRVCSQNVLCTANFESVWSYTAPSWNVKPETKRSLVSSG